MKELDTESEFYQNDMVFLFGQVRILLQNLIL